MDIWDLQQDCHELAREKGFWDKDRNIPEMLALIHAEVSEALEEYRKGLDKHFFYEVGEKPEGFAVELADAVIRIMDLAEGLKIDMTYFITKKLRYNKTRERMHGKNC